MFKREIMRFAVDHPRKIHFKSGLTFFVELDVSTATVELKHVDAPLGEGVGVVPHVASTPREAGASFAADVFVDAQFQTQIVHLEHTPSKKKQIMPNTVYMTYSYCDDY